MTDHQCPSCGGFCKKSGCERRDNIVPSYCRNDELKSQMNAYGQACFEEGRDARALVEPMDAVAIEYAHSLALELECVLADRGAYWERAMNLIGKYRSAMNAIHEQHSPTFMGEPAIRALVGEQT